MLKYDGHLLSMPPTLLVFRLILSTLSSSGFLLFKDFCENVYEEPVPQLAFYEEVSLFTCF